MLIDFGSSHPDVHESVFVAPGATLIGRVHVHEGASVWFNCVLRADLNSIEIGANTNIQDGCMLHVTSKHPLTIGERVTVGHGAILHGCKIGADCLISMGVLVLDGAVIGAGSIVAAGAVVAPGANVPANSVVMGIPAKVVRQVTDDDRHKIDRGWQNYLRYSGTYRGMGLNES